jgi:imidazole glycerol-phosphate synthase subunit HisH
MVNLAVYDYGAGNLFSLKAALERNGADDVKIIRDMTALKEFNGLVLPGVGNFDPAIRSIRPSKGFFLEAIEKHMPILGICLGMEMLFDKSEEGRLEGLKILEGKVVMLSRRTVKIPHMGWNNLDIIEKNDCELLRGVEDHSWVYYVHSYHTVPSDKNIVVASSDYGIKIPAVIEKDNLFGTQFHPEKSSEIGGIIIKNFIKVCSSRK